ncbi:hypothetical protein [Faecalicatena contorta]
MCQPILTISERWMKKRKRKTIIVCEECHRLIHNEM